MMCYALLHINTSYHLETAGQTLMSGGNNWFQRLFVKAEPHGMKLSSNGDLNLMRLRDEKVIVSVQAPVRQYRVVLYSATPACVW
jgi:hypothetical protein